MAGKYKAYQEYQDSGVEWFGEIPAHWKNKPLKYLCSFTGGGTPSKDNLSYWHGGTIPWVSPKDMGNFNLTNTQDKLTPAAVSASSTAYIEPGALILVVRSGILRRKIPTAINAVVVTLNQDMKALRFNDTVLVNYIAYVVYGKQKSLLLEWCKEGATVESIEHEYLANCAFPLPPLPEQQQIAKFLDFETAQIDRLIERQERLIGLLEEKRQAVISHAVTKGLNPDAPLRPSGIDWLGDVPEHWEVKKMAGCARITRLAGAEYTASWRPVEDGEIVALRGQNIGFNSINLANIERISDQLSKSLSRSRLSKGDIVYPCVGTIGNAALIEKDDTFHINQNIAKLTPKALIDPLFLTYFMNSKVCLESALFLNTSDAQPSILVSNLRRVKVPTPPIAEQQRIAIYLTGRLETIKQTSKKAQTTIDLLKERRTALISAAVTGKIDVRDWESPKDNFQSLEESASLTRASA